MNCQMTCRLEQAFLTFLKNSRKKLKAQTPKVHFPKNSDFFVKSKTFRDKHKISVELEKKSSLIKELGKKVCKTCGLMLSML